MEIVGFVDSRDLYLLPVTISPPAAPVAGYGRQLYSTRAIRWDAPAVRNRVTEGIKVAHHLNKKCEVSYPAGSRETQSSDYLLATLCLPG